MAYFHWSVHVNVDIFDLLNLNRPVSVAYLLDNLLYFDHLWHLHYLLYRHFHYFRHLDQSLNHSRHNHDLLYYFLNLNHLRHLN